MRVGRRALPMAMTISAPCSPHDVAGRPFDPAILEPISVPAIVRDGRCRRHAADRPHRAGCRVSLPEPLTNADMDQFDPDDDPDHPWLAIVVGLGFLLMAWYLDAKVEGDLHLVGKLALANSELGRKLLIGLCVFVGGVCLFRGVAQLRSRD